MLPGTNLPPLPPQGVKDDEPPGDAEEKINSPMFVPTVGKFFQHDTREGEGEEDTKEPE